jgi:succinate-semialdehyde dehydrogenase/glutarate-semialdehyde dehydrogenase
LSASVWSQDQKRAERLAHELEVGSVVVNDTIAHYAVSQLPFGGLKHSGTARTHGKQDVLQFTQTRSYGIGGVPFFLDVAARLREPQNYSLMSAIFHALFGVTPQQRLRAVRATADYIGQRWQQAAPGEKKRGAGKVAAVGAALAATVTALAALRRRDAQ